MTSLYMWTLFKIFPHWRMFTMIIIILIIVILISNSNEKFAFITQFVILTYMFIIFCTFFINRTVVLTKWTRRQTFGRIIFFYYIFYHRRPIQCYFISCWPFVVNGTFSTSLVGVEVSSLNGTTVEK